MDFLIPDWPAPKGVRAIQTLRHGGVSPEPWASLNLGDHVGDMAVSVAVNRQKVASFLPEMPTWLSQVHGTKVINLDGVPESLEADAACTRTLGRVCAVMTADCLPVILCDCRASVVAAAHAGWRGLHAGVLEETVRAMKTPSNELMAWLGPAIGPSAFEVGGEVRAAFLENNPKTEEAFAPSNKPEKFFANLYLLARQRLEDLGVTNIFGGDFCTYHDEQRFFSYRREHVTGRMATLVWLDDSLSV